MLEFIGLAVVGAAAGYIIGQARGDKGFGPLGNAAVGIAGALLGGFLLSLLGGLLGLLLTAAFGTLVIFWALGKFKKEEKPEPKDPFDERLKNL